MGIAQTSCRTYSYSELEALWIKNGGNPVSAPIAAAIAMAESGGDSCSYNPSDPAGGSRGLWQINGVHGSQSTFDANANAAAAVSISNNGSNWQPWTTFTSGKYRRFLSGNAVPDATLLSDTTGSSSQSHGPLKDQPDCVMGWTWPSIAGLGGGEVCIWHCGWSKAGLGGFMVIGGGIATLAGLMVLMASNKTVRNIAVGAAKVPGVGTGMGALVNIGRR